MLADKLRRFCSGLHVLRTSRRSMVALILKAVAFTPFDATITITMITLIVYDNTVTLMIFGLSIFLWHSVICMSLCFFICEWIVCRNVILLLFLSFVLLGVILSVINCQLLKCYVVTLRAVWSWFLSGEVSYPAGLILGLPPANGRLHYKRTPSLIGWAQT